ncbi:hypothetical protein OUZ56_033844 [Daphnia magna]|uniref:Uncharacterized protein n=1 Tax=Daphnia magna TaxID=35525 RepID=A0ABR0BB61_9CRUS|nr:hypothetical protein OUZ56_033844 [Daphnia magna]
MAVRQLLLVVPFKVLEMTMHSGCWMQGEGKRTKTVKLWAHRLGLNIRQINKIPQNLQHVLV